MAKVAVIYHSGTGHTKVLAESIVEGARSIEGVDCVLLEVRAEQIAATLAELEDLIAQGQNLPSLGKDLRLQSLRQRRARRTARL